MGDTRSVRVRHTTMAPDPTAVGGSRYTPLRACPAVALRRSTLKERLSLTSRGGGYSQKAASLDTSLALFPIFAGLGSAASAGLIGARSPRS